MGQLCLTYAGMRENNIIPQSNHDVMLHDVNIIRGDIVQARQLRTCIAKIIAAGCWLPEKYEF